MPDNKETIYADTSDLYGKKTQAVPTPEPQIGIDTNNNFFNDIIESAISSQLDVSAFNNFNQATRSRDQIYNLLDNMCNDATISAVLETYAEDATEVNDDGRIMWVDTSDADVAKYITYLLDVMKVDKNIYNWTHSLCKYGDLYLRLYRESEYDNDGLFDEKDKEADKSRRLNEDISLADPDIDKPTQLKEAVNIRAYSSNDKYVHYLEMQPNPANIFELTKFGKTYAYIQTDALPANGNMVNNSYGVANSNFINYQYYNFNKNDINVYAATEFVHGCLEDNTSRTPEKVSITINNNGDDKTNTYNVKRGQSLFYNDFKIWRELSLLENSVLLNRVTRSSLVRAIGVEIGDLPKEEIQPLLQGIKRLFEQSEALTAGQSLSEYTNPGPIENNVYIPTRNGKGALNIQQVGGDVNVNGLADVEHYRDKLFGSLRVPKQYFGFTDDGAGFNGGESLSIISSRYAKMVKRIQNVMCQTITDAVNLILIDRGLDKYINKFKLKMLAPTTREEIDRRENTAGKVQLTSDIMNMLGDIQDNTTKLKILKSLLGNFLNDIEVVDLLQQEIDKLENENEESEGGDSESVGEEEVSTEEDEEMDLSAPIDLGSDLGLSSSEETSTTSEEGNEEERTEEEPVLPTPDSLGLDLTDSDNVE